MRVGSLLQAVFWSRQRGRARIPWLIAIPILGAYATVTVVEILLRESLPQPALALAVIGSGTVAAVLLVAASSRFLGAPYALKEYGLRINRRWLVDLSAGLAAGAFAYAIPMLVALSTSAFSVEATFDPGDLALWPGIAFMVVACLCTGFWEELLMRGVFITNAMLGLQRRLSSRWAVTLAIVISATVFGLPHLAQPEYPALIFTWVFSGVVFGLIYVVSGNLAFVIGAHTTWNIVANVLFVRTEIPGAASQSAITRVSHDPEITALTSGGAIEAGGFILLGAMGLLWVLATRGSLRLRTPSRPQQSAATPSRPVRAPQPHSGAPHH